MGDRPKSLFDREVQEMRVLNTPPSTLWHESSGHARTSAAAVGFVSFRFFHVSGVLLGD